MAATARLAATIAILVVAVAAPVSLGGQAWSETLSGKLSGSMALRGSGLIVSNVVAPRGFSVVRVVDAPFLVVSGTVSIPRGSTLIVRAEGVSRVALENLTVAGDNWSSTLIVEAVQCQGLSIARVRVEAANLIVYATGCGTARIDRLFDPLGVSSVRIESAGLVEARRVMAGTLALVGVGALRVDNASFYSLEAQAEAYAGLEHVNASGPVRLEGSLLGPRIEIQDSRVRALSVRGSGMTIISGVDTGNVKVDTGQLVAARLVARSLNGSARRAVIASSTLLGVSLNSTMDLAVYNTSIYSDAVTPTGAQRSVPPITVSGPLESIAIIGSTLEAPPGTLAVKANITASQQSQAPGQAPSSVQPEQPAPPKPAPPALNVTVIGSTVAGSALLSLDTRGALLSLGVAGSDLSVASILRAPESTANVTVIGSRIAQLAWPASPLVSAQNGSLIVAGSRVSLRNPTILSASRGASSLVLARNNISAPPGVADSIAQVRPASVRVSLCLNESAPCSCGNKYSYSFQAGREHPVIYGVEDTYQGGTGIPRGCPVRPLLVVAALDHRYSNTWAAGAGIIVAAFYPGWANASAQGEPLAGGPAGQPGGWPGLKGAVGVLLARLEGEGSRVYASTVNVTVSTGTSERAERIRVLAVKPAQAEILVPREGVRARVSPEGGVLTLHRSAVTVSGLAQLGASTVCYAVLSGASLGGWLEGCGLRPPTAVAGPGPQAWAGLAVVADIGEPVWALVLSLPEGLSLGQALPAEPRDAGPALGGLALALPAVVVVAVGLAAARRRL